MTNIDIKKQTIHIYQLLSYFTLLAANDKVGERMLQPLAMMK